MPESDLIDNVPPIFTQLGRSEFIFESLNLMAMVSNCPPKTYEALTAVDALAVLVNASYRSQEASKLALSWRDYKVGASAVMCNFETGRRSFLDGYNVKPESGQGGLNLHAEQIAIAKGRVNGLNRVLGIAVYADPENDDANPYKNTSLRPCGRCIGMFEQASEVDDRMLIMGTNLDFTECELYTFGELKKAEVKDDKFTHNMLVEGSFALKTEADLDHYDREIKPMVVGSIMQLYS